MRISCIVPVYNAEPYLPEALESVLSQDWPIAEVIAVNDGSTDRSAEILDQYRASISRIDQPHSGVAVARNNGLRHASGDVIAFQDADDIWPAGRLRRMAEALVQDPSADIVAGRVEIHDEVGTQSRARRNPETAHRLGALPSLVIRRSVFDRVGLFNEALWVAEDSEFVARARLCSVSFKTIDVISLRYRLHADSTSANVARTQADSLEAMRSIIARRRNA